MLPFLLLLFLIHEAMATSVLGCTSNRDKDHRSRENCTGARFNQIPAGLDHRTQVLLFPNNLFPTLSWTSFQIFTEIYEIDLTDNKVPELSSSSAPILPSLSVLRLGSNHLTSLSDGSFTACPALIELYLENNSLSSLTDRTFFGLSRLEILDLTANHISILPDRMLHPLIAVETLYLENNKIQVMPDDWFSQKEEVPYLYLSENPWACSCSLGYLRRYLDDYEQNVYVRDGPLIRRDGDSVVCDSPQWHQGKPVLTLEESDLCSPSASEEAHPPGDFYQPLPINSSYNKSTADFFNTTPKPPNVPETSSLGLATPPPPGPTTTKHVTSGYPELDMVYHRVVTWSSTLLKRSYHSRSEISTESSLVGLFSQTTPPTPRTARRTTAPFRSTTNFSLTGTSTTPQMVPAYTTIETPLVLDQSVGIRQHFKVSSSGGGAVFCVWLFWGCLLLCLASAACVLLTVVRLILWYKKVYRPLSLTLARRAKVREEVAPLMSRSMEENAVAADGGVVALYRSLLFVHREGGDIEEEDRNREQIITLKPTAEEETDRRGREERGVYRKTMYRLLSKEEEIEGWRDVVEECRVSAEDRGSERDTRRSEEPAGGAAEVSTKRFSVILREEREEVRGRQQELDWVVGRWEVKGGAKEGPSSSWGGLAGFLPSMPWGLNALSEEEEPK